jgi:CHAD domain-containing protein
MERRRFQRRLAPAPPLPDGEAIHATRIAAKKLRYVVETLEPSDAAGVAAMLSELQDSLGAVHDMQLLVEHLLDEIEFTGGADTRRRARHTLGLEPEEDLAPSRRAVAGLTELARRAQSRAERAFLKFAETWNASRLDEIESAIARLAADLEAGQA